MRHSFGQIGIFGARFGAALVRRPHLWRTAFRQAHALAPRRWWAQSPHLPIPAPDYLRFRQLTATGSSDDLPAIPDIITWLEWCRSMRGLPREP